MATYELRAVLKRYGARTLALKAIDLTIAPREFLVLYGPAGAGKSTTLNLLAGITKPTSGDVLRDGQSIVAVPPDQRNAAMAFENYALYSHLSTFENLAFPLRARGMATAEVDARVRKIADVLGIGHVLDRRPAFLSGGQKQRVALGRAIIRPADIYLLDEPIGHLDAKLRHRMRAELKALAQDLNSTVVFTTTSSKEALALGDRVCVLNEGRIEQVGTPAEIYHRPANEFVASFVGDPPMSFVSVVPRVEDGAAVLSTLDGKPIGTVPAPVLDRAGGAPLRVGIRANQIRLTDPGSAGAVSGEVRVVEHLGYANILLIAMGDDLVSVSAPAGSRIRGGERVAVSIAEGGLHLFAGERAVHHAAGRMPEPAPALAGAR